MFSKNEARSSCHCDCVGAAPISTRPPDLSTHEILVDFGSLDTISKAPARPAGYDTKSKTTGLPVPSSTVTFASTLVGATSTPPMRSRIGANAKAVSRWVSIWTSLSLPPVLASPSNTAVVSPEAGRQPTNNATEHGSTCTTTVRTAGNR